MKKKIKLKCFTVGTFDGGGYLTSLTQAENHKKALRRMLTNSWDYKNIARSDRTLTITVKESK